MCMWISVSMGMNCAAVSVQINHCMVQAASHGLGFHVFLYMFECTFYYRMLSYGIQVKHIWNHIPYLMCFANQSVFG